MGYAFDYGLQNYDLMTSRSGFSVAYNYRTGGALPMETRVGPHCLDSPVAAILTPLVLAGLALGFVGCGGGGSNGDCNVPDRALAQEVFCRRAHECRASFALSDEEFMGRYGADYRACYDGPSLAEVDTVMTHAPTPEPPEPIDPNDPESVFWQLLMNCITAVGRASCEDVASGALLEDGNYCGDDVMQGLAPQPSLGDHECGDLVRIPDATDGP